MPTHSPQTHRSTVSFRPVRSEDVSGIVLRNVAASGTAQPLAYVRSYPSDANKNLGIGRPNDESEEWYKVVTINDDCPKKERYFADKLSTKMVEEAVDAVSRESLDCVK